MLNNTISIKAIAEKTGYSIATVSRVINKKSGNYSQETEEKIIKAISELNYYPNAAARGLRKGKTKLIAFITHYLSPYWLEFFQGAEFEAFNRGYILLVCNSENNIDIENAYINAIIENRVSGLIISSIVQNYANLEKVIKQDIPVITTSNEPVKMYQQVIKVKAKDSIVEAINHLKNQMYKNIGYISYPINNVPTLLERYRGFQQGLSKFNLQFNQNNIFFEEKLKNTSIDLGYDFIKKLIKEKKVNSDCYFFTSDSTAIGAIKALKEAGYKVPEDIGIVGFDNIMMSNYCDPTLTTIEVPKYVMGKRSVEILIDLIEKGKSNLTDEFASNLIIRESTQRR